MVVRLFAAVSLALVLSGTAGAATKQPFSWAAPQIQAVTAAGLMGASNPAAFRPNDVLTRQSLATLTFDLQQRLWPPDPFATTPSATTPANPNPTYTTAPAETTSDTAATTATTDPSGTDPTDPTTTTTPTLTLPAPPAPTVTDPNGLVTMAQLDAKFVAALGLSGAAKEFAAGARAAGLKVPSRFGTEVVARLLGLRLNHPAAEDALELRPNDPATRAEAAYSAAQVLGFTTDQLASVQGLADTFALPTFTSWQTAILDTAVSKIGMPYIWGGTSDTTETEFGVTSRGGYDCSGFVWRVYKLQAYPDEGTLASVLQGRTTFQMSGEVPASERIAFADLQPADVIFFGDRGPRSKPAQVGHMGIYLGNGWFVHSSSYGVAIESLTGWYRTKFAWARRPLAEAGLDTGL